MTYDDALTTYQRVLEANPGKAMLIGDDCYAVLINGCLYCAYLNLVGAIDLGKTYTFDQEAWDGEGECWSGDVSGMQTAFCIATPSLVELATPPTTNAPPNQGGKSLSRKAMLKLVGISCRAERMDSYQGSRSL